MKQFLKKSIFFISPLLLLFSIIIATFYILDPFKVINKYKEYPNSIVAYNEDYIATERFLKNKDEFNSFILGSSRAGCGFDTKDWNEKLTPTDMSFSFTASNESIIGVLGKLKLMEEENTRIENVLLVIDSDVTFGKAVYDGHLFIKHPRISGSSKSSFIQKYLQNYIFTGFFIRYLDYKIFEKKRAYMTNFLDFNYENQEGIYRAYDVSGKEAKILHDTDAYYDKNSDIFYPRSSNQKYSDPLLDSKKIKVIEGIKKIFISNNTKYKIIISPLYDQKRMNGADLNILKRVFGEENIFDFSGKNTITEDKYNYYESSHYRKKVGKQILNMVY